MSAPAVPHVRLARPSRDLAATTAFYTGGLGLSVLATFEDHAGIDGVVLGHPQWPYHLEFTRRRGDPLLPTGTPEDVIVIYLPDRAAWSSAVENLRTVGAREVVNANPYWRQHGVTFQDPDGYLLVLQNATSPAAPLDF